MMFVELSVDTLSRSIAKTYLYFSADMLSFLHSIFELLTDCVSAGLLWWRVVAVIGTGVVSRFLAPCIRTICQLKIGLLQTIICL
jgi:hypothetical protein